MHAISYSAAVRIEYRLYWLLGFCFVFFFNFSVLPVCVIYVAKILHCQLPPKLFKTTTMDYVTSDILYSYHGNKHELWSGSHKWSVLDEERQNMIV